MLWYFHADDTISGFTAEYRTMMSHVLAANPVDTGHWQAVKNVPMTRTLEVRNVAFTMAIPPEKRTLADYIDPNLPWAEDHFQERVAGAPTNPGDQYMNWPWYKPEWEAQKCADCGRSGKEHQAGGDMYSVCTFKPEEAQFSHTYQERMWPRWAGGTEGSYLPQGNEGIRYRYGDLNDVVNLLAREPHTRQAYVPIWFPEDTGAAHDERVPCTLGYHLMLRDGFLHINYFIRSCDIVRYFRDDVYMAGRLCQWIIEAVDKKQGDEVADGDVDWSQVKPGELSMFIHSLHCFEDEAPALRRKWLDV